MVAGSGARRSSMVALAGVSGNSGDYENTCCMSPSKSFCTCERYIICCWLWASCHLAPIKTPLCNSAPFSQRTRSWQNTVQHTPPPPDGPHTSSSEPRPVSGLCRRWLSRGQDSSPPMCLLTASRLQKVKLWAAVSSRA